jgi:hypothetical protein
MLWYDNDPHSTLEAKIQRAARYYRDKYGRLPDLCLVHPNMLDGGKLTSQQQQITIRTYRPVLPGHFWLGVEDSA